MYEKDDDRIYKVIVNHEVQYSIWPADKTNALGLDGLGQEWYESRVSGLYQRSLDRYAAFEPEEENGKGSQLIGAKLATRSRDGCGPGFIHFVGCGLVLRGRAQQRPDC